jgi:maleate isomerase
MASLCPVGVVTYSTRILFEPTIRGLRDMKDGIKRASSELSSEGICQIIAFCCTVGSMIDGADYDRDIIHLIEEQAKVPAITTTTAVRAALDVLGAVRIAVATPYTREIVQREKAILEGMGYEIMKIIGFHEDIPAEMFRNEMIGRLSPEEAYQLGLEVNSSQNEAIFISCTNFRALEVIQYLEEKTGKPVVSSNQATMWYALRKLGINDSIKGFGQLLDQH